MCVCVHDEWVMRYAHQIIHIRTHTHTDTQAQAQVQVKTQAQAQTQAQAKAPTDTQTCRHKTLPDDINFSVGNVLTHRHTDTQTP